MAQWIKHLLYKPELIPGAHVNREGKNQLHQVVLWRPHVHIMHVHITLSGWAMLLRKPPVVKHKSQW